MTVIFGDKSIENWLFKIKLNFSMLPLEVWGQFM